MTIQGPTKRFVLVKHALIQDQPIPAGALVAIQPVLGLMLKCNFALAIPLSAMDINRNERAVASIYHYTTTPREPKQSAQAL